MADHTGYTTVTLADEDGDDSGEGFSGTESTMLKAAEGLQFHDFPESDLDLPTVESDRTSATGTTGKISGLVPESDSSEDEGDKSGLLSREKKAPSFWKFEYYQAFFDVDTNQVMNRILFSMVPTYGKNYLMYRVRPNPDLYGPFWVCATLVFTIAVSGNLANYFASEGESEWKYNFHKVTLAGCVVYSYAWLMPAALWGFLIWRGNNAGFSFLEIVCVYGYSLSVFIPVSILWVFPQEWLRWILVVVGVILSGSVLALTFWRALEDNSKKIAVIALIFIVLLHCTLAIGFKLYFFKTASFVSIATPYPTSPIVTTTSLYSIKMTSAL